jgi:hypothetical protein
MKELAEVNLTSGVNEKGEGFVTISVVTTTKDIILGQLDPQTTRTMAMQWLEVAEAAEQDAAAWRVIQKLELPEQLAAMIVTELRNSRSEG